MANEISAKRKVFKTIKEYLIISIGVFLYCASWIAFVSSKGISGGALPGVATIVQFATGIPIAYTYFTINAGLLIVGTIVLGKGFGFKTVYSFLLASVLFRILPDIDWINNLSDIQEVFINAIIGGTIGAIGIALVFKNGGSTGGTDIVALIISKYREISPGKVFLYCDLIIIGSIIFLPGRGLQDVVYGYLQMVSFSFMVDALLTGNNQSVQLLIFSQKYSDIADAIVNRVHGGVTAVRSRGWYLKKESEVLIVIARKIQMDQITSVAKEIDPNVFISVTSAMNVYGNGFAQIKKKIRLKIMDI